MAGIVVVFDFDKTIIDVDSDNWVIDELGATDLFNQLNSSMPWNCLMDRMMKELHSQGTTIEDIEEVLKRVPIHPRKVPAIKSAHTFGCDLRVVSDANVFFIETILKHLGIRECFTEIHTNPGYVDEEGRLRVLPYHDSHTCSNLCPPNMCKGLILERIQASMPKDGKKRMIYLGDGIGDFCPSLKIKEGDFVMPRKDFPVWNLITQNRTLLEAEIHEWTDGEELEHMLLQLINAITIQEESLLLSVECKFQTAVSHDSLPKALPVQHSSEHTFSIYEEARPQFIVCGRSKTCNYRRFQMDKMSCPKAWKVMLSRANNMQQRNIAQMCTNLRWCSYSTFP